LYKFEFGVCFVLILLLVSISCSSLPGTQREADALIHHLFKMRGEWEQLPHLEYKAAACRTRKDLKHQIPFP
jgi:hypothetical protein